MKTHKKALSAAQLAWYNGQTDLVCERDKDGMEAAIRAYLNARGLVMVPKEPTDRMKSEGASANAYCGGEDTGLAEHIYVSMLAAAPDPFK